MTEEDARGGMRWRQIIQGPAKRRRTKLVNVFIYFILFYKLCDMWHTCICEISLLKEKIKIIKGTFMQTLMTIQSLQRT